jgi:hypothetical protein
MSHATRGMSNHLMLESFERTHKHLLKIGFPAVDAMRGALAMTFRLSGAFDIDQAWEAADEIINDIPGSQAEAAISSAASQASSTVFQSTPPEKGDSIRHIACASSRPFQSTPQEGTTEQLYQRSDQFSIEEPDGH